MFLPPSASFIVRSLVLCPVVHCAVARDSGEASGGPRNRRRGCPSPQQRRETRKGGERTGELESNSRSLTRSETRCRPAHSPPLRCCSLAPRPCRTPPPTPWSPRHPPPHHQPVDCGTSSQRTTAMECARTTHACWEYCEDSDTSAHATHCDTATADRVKHRPVNSHTSAQRFDALESMSLTVGSPFALSGACVVVLCAFRCSGCSVVCRVCGTAPRFASLTRW